MCTKLNLPHIYGAKYGPRPSFCLAALAVVAVLALLVSSDRKNSHSLRHSVTCYRSITGWFFLNSDVGLAS